MSILPTRDASPERERSLGSHLHDLPVGCGAATVSSRPQALGSQAIR